MKKRVISLLLTGVMAASILAGCGSSSEEEVTTSSAALEEEDDEEITEINICALALGSSDGVQEVEDAVNEISEAEIGVHINLTLIDAGSFAEQVSLMLSGNEQIDLMQVTPLGSVGFNSCLAQNQLTDISDLLEEYAPELTETVGEYIKGMQVDGATYGVPGYRLLNSDMYVYMRADILDELGLRDEAEAMDSWSDVTAIFDQVYAAQDSLPSEMQTSAMISNSGGMGDIITVQPALAGDDSWSNAKGYDTLGDTYYIVGVDEETDQVFNWYASEDFQEEIATVKDWYEKGYVYRDASISEDTGDTNVKNGIAFANVCFSEPGIAQSKASATGYEVVCKKISTGPVTTGSARSWGWAVPVTAKESEAAVKFLNLMYTNADVENLLAWGIEERDYELNEEGEAVSLDSATYVSGDFLWGNQFNAYPAAGQGGDFRETSKAEMEEAGISKYYGCSVSTDSISNELTAVNNVINTYYPSIVSGSSSDLDADYQAFIDAMEAAGVQTILDTYQTTLDEWLAEQ